jgi:hypothetical protein
MSGPLAWGAGMGLDGTAASYRRYTGLGGYVIVMVSKRVLINRMLTGYPLGMQMPGRPGLGGYWGVSTT